MRQRQLPGQKTVPWRATSRQHCVRRLIVYKNNTLIEVIFSPLYETKTSNKKLLKQHLINPFGIAEMNMGAVNPAAAMPVRAFGTFTQDLHDLADCLRERLPISWTDFRVV